MHDYVVQELPALVEAHSRRPTSAASAVTPWAGHGALVCALRNPGRYLSVSAFSPISNPMDCPWGEKPFPLPGEDRARWREWDASVLLAEAASAAVAGGPGRPRRLPAVQLKPEALQQAARKGGHPLTLRLQPGYDHSYYFIASFIEDHLRHHAVACGLMVPPKLQQVESRPDSFRAFFYAYWPRLRCAPFLRRRFHHPGRRAYPHHTACWPIPTATCCCTP
jgi:S-formylglutathione hydrolase